MTISANDRSLHGFTHLAGANRTRLIIGQIGFGRMKIRPSRFQLDSKGSRSAPLLDQIVSVSRRKPEALSIGLILLPYVTHRDVLFPKRLVLRWIIDSFSHWREENYWDTKRRFLVEPDWTIKSQRNVHDSPFHPSDSPWIVVPVVEVGVAVDLRVEEAIRQLSRRKIRLCSITSPRDEIFTLDELFVNREE